MALAMMPAGKLLRQTAESEHLITSHALRTGEPARYLNVVSSRWNRGSSRRLS